MSADNFTLRTAKGLVHESNRTFEVRSPPEDAVSARISLLAGWQGAVMDRCHDAKEQRTSRTAQSFCGCNQEPSLVAFIRFTSKTQTVPNTVPTPVDPQARRKFLSLETILAELRQTNSNAACRSR
ncbi:hypothetical protein [Desulfosporosinus sp. BG]|uniref:hypothetical protein n=1 Tax=Desulfosporosinus sp. BG TaxID=1633135 RepID=UPI00114C89D5|nr:hypothetical protein [Desulfosporosinus sp. BG]